MTQLALVALRGLHAAPGVQVTVAIKGHVVLLATDDVSDLDSYELVNKLWFMATSPTHDNNLRLLSQAQGRRIIAGNLGDPVLG